MANAALVDRGGGLIYDSDLNVTWLQDTNYAQTSGYDADGLMDWNQAATWAANLTYGGYSDWRLFTSTDTGAPGAQCTYSGTDCGYNVDPASSEMAHLFHIELGNISYATTSGAGRSGTSGVDWGLVNQGPFINFQSYGYWSGTEYTVYADDAWIFDTYYGQVQTGNDAGGLGKTHNLYALAVRDGDVSVSAVPIPAAVWLFGSGLLGLIGFARRKKNIIRKFVGN